MLEQLKERVLKANLELVKYGLTLFSVGSVSQIDRESGMIVIKPEGIAWEKMKAEDMSVVDRDGNPVEGNPPSTDAPAHIEFYRAFPEVGGVAHTHSTYATAWAQAGRSIPFYGATHADFFYGDIPCARALTKEEIEGEYEKNTGLAVIEKFRNSSLKPLEISGALVRSHGVFSFGTDADVAVRNAAAIEEVAKMAAVTEQIAPHAERADQYIMDKHYLRRHGKVARPGQTQNK